MIEIYQALRHEHRLPKILKSVSGTFLARTCADTLEKMAKIKTRKNFVSHGMFHRVRSLFSFHILFSLFSYRD